MPEGAGSEEEEFLFGPLRAIDGGKVKMLNDSQPIDSMATGRQAADARDGTVARRWRHPPTGSPGWGSSGCGSRAWWWRRSQSRGRGNGNALVKRSGGVGSFNPDLTE